MKKRLLIVVDHLLQHGVERYTYELCKAIDKEEFEVTVLSLNKLHEANNYYGPLLRQLNVNVIDYDRESVFRVFNNRWLDDLVKKLIGITKLIGKDIGRQLQHRLLHKILNQYQVIALMKIENFNAYQEVFAEYKNLIIHLLSTQAQYPVNPYINLPARNYNFVLFSDDQKAHVLGTDFIAPVNKGQLQFHELPLFMDLTGRYNTYLQKETEEPVIGIFSRISMDQPTIIMLVAFSLVIKRYPNAKLLFFGACYEQYVQDFFMLNCEILKMQNNVKFMGHVPDLKEAIVTNKISLAWMNMAGDAMGYSSIEILSYGLPAVFFDTAISGNVATGLVVENRKLCFKDIEEFVEITATVLANHQEREKLSKILYKYVHAKYEVDGNRIEELQQLYSSLVAGV